MDKKNLAFTLAEVLITLGIIGVVAALTMPALIANYKKQEMVTRLKKTYNTLSNAVRRAEADYGDYAEWDVAGDIGERAYFDKYWKPYLVIMKECTTWTQCGYKADAPWSNADGTQITAAAVRGVGFVTPDGAYVNVRAFSGTSTAPSPLIMLDLNGPKPPNVLGRDYFQLNRNANGTITPQDIYSKKIIEDGWQIKDNYPIKI
ncbi:MAG: type II secretion system GspH family protein [Heliobacteriaceae bacterium]|jgi:prepilin-type N-terminal cleavage/methylation domain-containing protein|nr:type II secretion system GspH family protein [Heliobacteriaceae bacterium]